MSKKIFILDDEPMFLDWIDDYVTSLGFSVDFLTSLKEASDRIEAATLDEYAVLIIDLNVPASAEIESILQQKETVFQEFRGLFIAQRARTKGISGNKIIVYSVHDKPEVEAICKRLNIYYMPKGRAKSLKEKLASILGVA
ncbi:hypothetical protein ACTXJ5_06445 [Psychrobacter alimentarius]|uniref:hypothetical protein n=1 Tax=Psychrobacter alimentarius TaxID=261164 RepID=UPI003FD2C219